MFSYYVWRYGRELLSNAKKHGIEVHGYTEETWNEEVSKNLDHFRKLIKTS